MTVVSIFGNRYQGDFVNDVRDFVENLASRSDTTVVVERDFFDYLAGAGYLPSGIGTFDTCDRRADIAVCFGGDGTVLSTARAVSGLDIPVMGVNTGHLGYLSGASIEDLGSLHEMVAERRYVVERRMMLQVESDQLPEGFDPYALNEVAILKGDSASMISVEAWLDDNMLALYKADGLLVSTPTGSTAYNLSVGGPVIAPRSGVCVISPIAPHTLTMRPIVVSDESVIRLAVESRTPSFRLSVDGRSADISAGATLVVRRADRITLLAHPEGHNFLDTLRTKLLWGK